MPCLICGSMDTINAHIVPKAIALDARGGKSAKKPLREISTNSRRSSQAGTYDPNILCRAHDEHLGKNFDKPAVEFLRLLGSKNETNLDDRVQIESNIAPSILEKFAISIAWRASVSSVIDDFSVGQRNESLWKDALFFGSQCKIKVMVWRLYDSNLPERTFFHYPIRHRDKDRRNVVSFCAGGLLFDIGTDKINASYVEKITFSSINRSYPPITILKASMDETGVKDAMINSLKTSRW